MVCYKVGSLIEVTTCFDEGTLEQRSRPTEGRRCSLCFWGSQAALLRVLKSRGHQHPRTSAHRYLRTFADAAPCAQGVFARVGRPLHFLFIFPGRFLQRSAPIQGTLDQRSPRPAEGAGVSCRCSLGKPTTLSVVCFFVLLLFVLFILLCCIMI